MAAFAEPTLELNKKKHSAPQSGIAPSQLDPLEREIAASSLEAQNYFRSRLRSRKKRLAGRSASRRMK